jgi:transcriptional regulator with PAS, ATPase and Fis domain
VSPDFFDPLDTTVPDLGGPGGGPNSDAAHGIRWVFPESDRPSMRLRPGVTAIGRDPDVSAHLPDPSVSRRHAEIRWTVGAPPMLRDLESRNGVYLNGRRITQAPMKANDVIRLGDWVGVLTVDAADAPWTFEQLIPGYWAGPALASSLAPARLAARSDLPIVIQGETGTGKEGAARAVHTWAGRGGPFLALNCATVPEQIADAELFGYRKGAFTDADRAHAGLLRAADGGTLFLDEVVDLPATVQPKLLRAIEQKEIIPIGESRPVKVDVRLVIATQGPLRQAVEDKRFRGDLYARLDGLVVVLPPLRERVAEIPALFTKLLEGCTGAATPPRLHAKLVESLCVHDWPFNVRELANLARRVVALHPGAETLPAVAVGEPATPPAATAEPDVVAEKANVQRQPEPDREAVLAALRDKRGNVRQAAAALHISRTRLYRLMEKIDSPALASFRE